MRITSLTPDSRYFIFFLRKSSAFSTAFSFTFSFTESFVGRCSRIQPELFPYFADCLVCHCFYCLIGACLFVSSDTLGEEKVPPIFRSRVVSLAISPADAGNLIFPE